MKLIYHKRLEFCLLKNGFTIQTKTEFSVFLISGKFKIHIFHSSKALFIYFRTSGNTFLVNGCKTIHDLYRLERLIEGEASKSLMP